MDEERASWSGIVLAGPPGAGKRTVAFALTTLARRYERLPALSTARESTLDVESSASAQHIDELRAWAQVLYESNRHGAAHIYDHERLRTIRDAGQLAVVALDTASALEAFTRESPDWLTVALHGPHDPSRTAVPRRSWARTDHELARVRDRFVMALRTDRLAALEVARLVDRAVQQHDRDPAGHRPPSGPQSVRRPVHGETSSS